MRALWNYKSSLWKEGHKVASWRFLLVFPSCLTYCVSTPPHSHISAEFTTTKSHNWHRNSDRGCWVSIKAFQERKLHESVAVDGLLVTDLTDWAHSSPLVSPHPATLRELTTWISDTWPPRCDLWNPAGRLKAADSHQAEFDAVKQQLMQTLHNIAL